MIVKKKELKIISITFFVFFILISQIFLSNVLVSAKEMVESDSSDTRIGILGKLMKVFGKFATIFAPNINPFLVAVVSKPAYVEIGYNENVTIEVGLLNLRVGDFQTVGPSGGGGLFTSRYIYFEVVNYPSNNPYSWFVTTNPNRIDVKAGVQLKTNVTISLISPPVAGNTIQSGILKILINDIWAYGNLWWPKNFPGFETFFAKFSWLLGAIILRYGIYSGKISFESKEVEILVKVKPYHYLKFDALPPMTFRPNEVTSIPISLQNLGNYNDTFGFRVVSQHDDILISDPITITLAPGETKDTYLGVYIPPSIFDYGTPHFIRIEAYSTDEPNVTIDEASVFLESRGVYFSEISIIGIIFLIIAIFVIVAFYFRRQKLFFDKYCEKPDKPWELPEEKTHLEKLMKEDKTKYEKELQMMHDEYDSALLWYKYYCQKLKAPKPAKRKIKKEEVKKKKEVVKEIREEKPKKIKKIKFPKKEEKKEEKEEKKQEIKEEIKEASIVQKVDIKKIKRDEIISRIKREQEKQKKELKKGE